MSFTINDIKKHLGPGLGLRKNRYLIEIPVPLVNGETLNILCQSAGLPERNISTTEMWHKGRKYQVRGETDYIGDYEISIVDDSSMRIRALFDGWLRKVDDSRPQKDDSILGTSFEEISPGLLENISDAISATEAVTDILSSRDKRQDFILGLFNDNSKYSRRNRTARRAPNLPNSTENFGPLGPADNAALPRTSAGRVSLSPTLSLCKCASVVENSCTITVISAVKLSSSGHICASVSWGCETADLDSFRADPMMIFPLTSVSPSLKDNTQTDVSQCPSACNSADGCATRRRGRNLACANSSSAARVKTVSTKGATNAKSVCDGVRFSLALPTIRPMV